MGYSFCGLMCFIGEHLLEALCSRGLLLYLCSMFPFQNSRVDTIQSELIGHGFEFDMLRDDLIHPIVSGNKWRKLKYIIQFAQENAYKQLVTFGGAYSNHLVATAFAGHYFGLQTVGFVRGDEERALNHYELLCIENGMQLIHVDRTAFRNKEVLFNTHFSEADKALFVSEGGDHPLALPGCAEILNELNKSYDFIVLSMGTGTTMEGIVGEVQKRGLPTKVLGISSLKNNFDLDKKLSKYDAQYYQIYHDYHRGKYAKSDDALLQFINDFYAETGIKTEAVYTGKMLMALDDLIQNGVIGSHHRVLCVHTGGWMG